jgi:uncharacterized protein (DUF427 family)
MRSASSLPPSSESVWDYPRPPRIEPARRRVRVIVDGVTIADSRAALRVLETSHPPVYYVPPGDVRMELLEPSTRHSLCEYKGVASYRNLRAGSRSVVDVCWLYLQPLAGYEPLAGHIAFYPGRVDACYLDDELVTAQEGDFYGGWISSEVRGPFKGGPGTTGW